MALELSKTFDNVTGLDPEEGMVKAGLQPEGKRIAYHVGTAEDLRAIGIKDNSVDLVVAGEAAHYFNHSVTWPELARFLRPSGTVCWAVRVFPYHADSRGTAA
jgi:ubiquinone/menaquinone biosynthesis C-methylase UbiE